MVKVESLQNASKYANVDGEKGFQGARVEGGNRRVATRYAQVPSTTDSEDDYVRVTIKFDTNINASDTEYTVALERAYVLALEEIGTAPGRTAMAAGPIEGTFTDSI